MLYTATATTATGCYTTANATAITVNASPVAPSGSSTVANQCGTPMFVATSSVSSPIYKFYDAATSGNLLQSGSSNTYIKSSFVVGVNSVWAVSYTHLDVYKRQLMLFIQQLLQMQQLVATQV